MSPTKWVEVEAGVKIGVLWHLLRHGLILSVMPGHPNISVGGAWLSMYTVRTIRGMELSETRSFHSHCLPLLGLISDVTREDPIFDATLGGMGLTGIILSAKIALTPIAGTLCALDIFPVSGLEQGREVLLENNSSADFSYSWHDLRPVLDMDMSYLAIFVISQAAPQGGKAALQIQPGRAMAFLNKFSIPCATFAYGKVLNSKTEKTINLFDAVFPCPKATCISHFMAAAVSWNIRLLSPTTDGCLM